MKFDIRVSAETELAIYNVLGQKVATLENDLLAPGTYSAVWNGTTDNGTPVTSGIYYARMTARPTGDAEPFVALRKLLLMK
jgi:flagellar hook assembly protein FlgD